MKIEIKKGNLNLIMGLFYDIKLKPRLNRHRVNFIKHLEGAFKKTEEERTQIAKDYAKKDDKGEPVVNEGVYDIENMEDFKSDVRDMFEEVHVIEGANNQDMLKGMKRVMKEFDDALGGKQAIVFEDLYQQFQKGGK